MRSAVHFLPPHMIVLTNRVTRALLNLGSCGITRTIALRRRDIRIDYFPALTTLGLALSLGRLTPYFDRLTRRFSTPDASNLPRTMWYLTPGKSLTRPPRTITIECSCRLCPSSGMYAITSYPFVSRTLATFRIAEFGFLGVRVITCMQTPRLNGERPKAGDFDLRFSLLRPFRTSWFIVGISAD